MNRSWRYPDPYLDSGVYEFKKLLIKLKKKSLHGAHNPEPVMFLDLHGHSRKTNLFAYGFSSSFQPTDHRYYTVRMFPKILSMMAPEFSYKNCQFGGGGPSKRGTGRVVVAKDIG
jgi:hypothetical protein